MTKRFPVLLPSLLGLALFGACKKEASPTAPSPEKAAKKTAAAGAAPAAKAPPGDATPEPEVGPCKNCQIDVAGRLTGTIQLVTTCPATGEALTYPMAAPKIEVIGGEQAGETFEVPAEPAQWNEGDTLSAKVGAPAKPDGWMEAVLWLEDGEGHRCASDLKIQR